MSLNIKNEHTHELVRRLAALTGMSQTSAVEDAVRRRLEELDHDASSSDEEAERRWQALRLSLEPFWATITEENRAATHAFMDDMYDELGLPK